MILTRMEITDRDIPPSPTLVHLNAREKYLVMDVILATVGAGIGHVVSGNKYGTLFGAWSNFSVEYPVIIGVPTVLSSVAFIGIKLATDALLKDYSFWLKGGVTYVCANSLAFLFFYPVREHDRDLQGINPIRVIWHLWNPVALTLLASYIPTAIDFIAKYTILNNVAILCSAAGEAFFCIATGMDVPALVSAYKDPLQTSLAKRVKDCCMGIFLTLVFARTTETLYGHSTFSHVPILTAIFLSAIGYSTYRVNKASRK